MNFSVKEKKMADCLCEALPFVSLVHSAVLHFKSIYEKAAIQEYVFWKNGKHSSIIFTALQYRLPINPLDWRYTVGSVAACHSERTSEV